MDNAKPSFIISILRGFIFIMPLIFILSYIFNMTGVWLSFPVAEILSSLFSVLYFIKNNKKRFAS